MRARMIEHLMCDFRIEGDEIIRRFGIGQYELGELFAKAQRAFPDMLLVEGNNLLVPPDARPLTRMIARSFDAYDLSKAGHSSAI